MTEQDNNTVKVEVVERNEVSQQIQGMKELFTSLLTQNKKEYEEQLNQMKQLFVETLTTTQQQFQQQITELTKTVPQLMDKTLLEAQNKNLVYLGNLSETEKADKMEKLDAVTELLSGEEIRQLQQQLQQVETNIKTTFEQDHQTVKNLQTSAQELFDTTVERLLAQVTKTQENLNQWFQVQDEKLAHRDTTSRSLQEFGISKKF